MTKNTRVARRILKSEKACDGMDGCNKRSREISWGSIWVLVAILTLIGLFVLE